ncbi:MAG: septation protein A [Deltaproteobacteria bacterium]|nr:septation protein A [Deltaproteobacteria bacterium]
MKLLFDLFPIALFFGAYKLKGIFVATGVAIAASVALILWSFLRKRRVETMQWVSLAVIAVFGGATLVLHDETYIKWKPTVLYWLFAAVLLGSATFFKKNLIAAMMSSQLTLPEPVWQKLNLSWAGFFAVLGGLNLYVAMHYPTNTWVNFKLFGTTGLMLVFALLQGLAVARYAEEKDGT